jgi:hypothetical protein
MITRRMFHARLVAAFSKNVVTGPQMAFAASDGRARL